MSGQIHAVLSAMDRLLDWFMPPEMANDRDAQKQVRMFLISHLFGPFIGNVVPLSLYILDPTPGSDVLVLALAITSFWVFPFILKWTNRYGALVLVSVQILNFCILWSCYHYGGVSSPTLAWIVTIPLLASFYVGSDKSLRISVMAISSVNFAVFFALYDLTDPPLSDMSLAAVQGLGIVSTAAASLYVSMMAFYYAKILASGVELELEVRGHLETAAELRHAAAEAERSGAAKAEFLAKMSHELRTPLNAVIGYSQMLLEDADHEGDAETASDLKKIHDAGQHLLGLVNDVLDLSKIVAGKMEVVSGPVTIGPLIHGSADTYRTLAESNGNIMEVAIDGDVDCVVTDQDKLGKIVCHLIENAAKFTHDGKIGVTVRRKMVNATDSIEIEVNDNGIGIAKELIPELFEKFNVARDSSSSKYGGTGLGLALCQRLTRLLGGDISVESRVGRGSRFTLWIPTSPQQSGALSANIMDEDAARLSETVADEDSLAHAA